MVRERVKETLKELIAIPSVSGKEREVLEYIERRLNSVGLELKKQFVEENRYNLIYDNGSDFLISVHVDTVPPAGFKKAYKPEERNGRIYGRGASDVKGAVASLITAVEWFKRDFPDRDIPVSLAFVVDEEQNTALGSEKLPEFLEGKKRCLVLEPTYGLLCTKQMGAVEFSVKVMCRSAHGAEFEKVENPTKVFINFLKELEKELGREVNVIMIRSGSRVYTVPKECEALLEFKVFEGESPEELIGKIEKVKERLNTECDLSVKVEDTEAFQVFNTDGLLPILKRVLEKVEGEAKEGVMPSWTDASNYHKAGYHCVVFGYGSLLDSHTDRESISVEELEKFTKFFYELFKELSDS
ncbi:M20 family metallopeptidase [Aquifex pyrophilus]